MTAYDLPPTDDRLVWDTWLSMNHLPAISVADELGVLQSLLESPVSAADLSVRLGYDRRATVAVVRMLAALGYLHQQGGVYQLTEPAQLYLLKNSPYYWGHMLGNRTELHDWLKGCMQGRSPEGVPGHRGEDAPAEGAPASSWAAGDVAVEQARRIAAAMHSHSVPAANGLARTIDFANTRRLLDVGAGSGCYAISLVHNNPSLHATLMELPAMCEVAQEYVRDASVESRVDTVAVDMFREQWPEGYDAVFFANTWHDWNFDTCSFLAKKAYDILPSGGHILLHEMLLDDNGDGPLTTVSFSMLMLGTEGQQFTLEDLRTILEDAGFTDLQSQNTYGYYSLVSALKP